MIRGVFPFNSPYFRSHTITRQLYIIPPNINKFLQVVVQKHVSFFAQPSFGFDKLVARSRPISTKVSFKCWKQIKFISIK